MVEPRTITAEKAFKLRKRAKKKKPCFARQESWKYIRLKENWRRPHGLDNKVRKRFKGWPARVSIGYRGPKGARKLHPSGFEEVRMHNADGLKKIDPKTQVVRIAHTVGKRTRAKILAEAREKGITILNVKLTKPEVGKEEKDEKEAEETVAETKEELKKKEPEEEEKPREAEKK